MLQSPALRCPSLAPSAISVHSMTIGFAVRLGQCNLINHDKPLCIPLTHTHKALMNS